MPDARPFVAGATGAGGGGLGSLGPPTNSFNAATEAAAETARNTYATANAAWLASYDAQPTYTIVISWPVTPTNTKYQSRRGGAWADVTPIIRGQTGIPGTDGAQARFPLQEHANGSATPTLVGGGTFNLDTGVFTPSTGATAAPTPPGVGEDVYARETYVDDAVDSGLVDLSARWSAWVERSHLSSGISHVEVTAGDFTGSGISGDPIALDATRTFEANPTGDPTSNLLTVSLGGVTYNVDEIVDVTGTGLPGITVDNHRSLWIDFDTPRVWVGHRESVPGTFALGAFNQYNNTSYFGARQTDPSNPPNTNQYYYRTTTHTWRGYGRSGGFPPRVRWSNRSFSSIFGGTSRWLGEQAGDGNAVNLIENFDTTRAYYYFSVTTGHVELLDNSTYVPPVDPSYHYVAEPISAPTGVGSIAGIIAGAGMTGGGMSGVVTVNVAPSEADFPTIPVNRGGTGATDAAGARSNLDIGASLFAVPTAGVGGTADAIELTTGFGLTALSHGQRFFFNSSGQNTGAVSIAVDSINSRQLLKNNGNGGSANLLAGDIRASDPTLILFDSDQGVFWLQAGNIGTAAFRNAGTAANDVPTLDSSGLIPTALLPSGLAGGFTLRVGDDAPDDSIGQDGDWYIARTLGTFSRKNAGAWVVQYTDKLGMAGTLDGTLLSGSGAPANALGANGDSYLDVDEGDFYKKASDVWTLTFSAPWLTQNRVDARITNRIAPRIFVATAAFTQSISIIAFPVTPTTTDAPAIGDVVMVRTPAVVTASTGVALAMAIDGIGGSATYILDRSDGLGLNAAELATNSIYMTVFDGTNFELVGQPLSPNVALLTGAVFNGITEGLDPTTAQGFVTRAHLGLQTPTYTASASSWDEASQTITLTLPVGSVVPGDEIIFLVPPVLTGQDDTAVQINVGGRTGTLRTFQSFTTLVLSRELVPREILLVQASGGDTYRMLEPHIVQRTGIWNSGRLYVLGQEATLNGFDYKLLTETSINQNPETDPSVWLRFPHIWQDEGVSFTDPITGTNFAGEGVSTAVVNGVLTVTITGTSSPPPGDHNRYLALGNDALFTEADYTGGTVFTTDVVVFPTFTDASFPGVVVPADQPISTFTQLGAFEQDLTGFFNQIADIDIGGTNHHQWVGTQRFPNSYSGVRMRLS